MFPDLFREEYNGRANIWKRYIVLFVYAVCDFVMECRHLESGHWKWFHCCCCLFLLGVMYMCLVLSSMSGFLDPHMLIVSYEIIDDCMVYCLGATLCRYMNIMPDMVSTS